MRKILILLFFISTYNYSQNCKYKINEVDEFTKNVILETKEGTLTISGMGLGFSSGYTLKKINNNRYLNLIIMSPSIFSLRKDDKIMFKTNSETTIDLFFSESIIANSTYNSTIKSTHWSGNILLPISEDNYQRFLKEKIIKLRIYTNDGYIDDDINNKRSKKFQDYLKCI